jgi:ABC-2 type transport system permease protein
MNNLRQIKSGLRKEILFFTRSFRLLGIILVFAGSALFSPIMAALMSFMSETFEMSLDGVYDATTAQAMEEFEAITNMFTLNMTYNSSLAMFATAAVLMMILLTGTAGKEQKKRSIIMPQIAGLTPAGYVLPKFILYPPAVFALTVISAALANGACHLVFGESYTMTEVLATGSLYGVFLMFMVSLYLFLGISLAQPGLSVLYVFAGNLLFETLILMVFEIDRFTPWNLASMAAFILAEQQPPAIAATVTITLLLCVAFMLLTLFAMVAKQMDNTSDEVY